MEQDRVKKYAQSLEKNLQSTHHYIKKTLEDFQEKCLLVSPEKNVPRDIIVDIRETYKEIRERLTETKALQQLLKGKYRQYVQSNPQRDKELSELGFLAKTCYSKFEYTLMQIQAKGRAKERARLKEKERSSVEAPLESLEWFQLKENQDMFLQELKGLEASEEEPAGEVGKGERREGMESLSVVGPSVTLFVVRGDASSLDELQVQIQLRERDLIERYSQEELRGVLVHLREVDPSEIEHILQRFLRSVQLSNLKCLVVRVPSQKGLTQNLLSEIERNMEEIKGGEMRTLSV
jgi:hypothetical protein